MAKITYDDKVALNEEPSIAEINKVTDDNMNEIKTSVNNIYDNGLVNKGTIPNNTDLNNLTEEGVYSTAGNSFTNGPTINYNWSQIIVINQGSIIQQIFIKPVNGTIQIREYSGSPETWSSWKIVSYTDITNLQNYVEQCIDATSLGNWNSLPYKNGFYKGNSMSNSPSGSTINPGWWYVIQIVHDNTYVRQIAFSYRNNNQAIYSRAKQAGTWGSWTAIQEDSGWVDFTLKNSFTNAFPTFNSKYRKICNIVNINLAVKRSTVPTWGTVIATLPEGFRPIGELDIICRIGSQTSLATIAISTGGDITFLQANGSFIANNELFITATFITT